MRTAEAAVIGALLAGSAALQASAGASGASFHVSTVASGLDHPRRIAVMDDGLAVAEAGHGP